MWCNTLFLSLSALLLISSPGNSSGDELGGELSALFPECQNTTCSFLLRRNNSGGEQDGIILSRTSAPEEDLLRRLNRSGLMGNVSCADDHCLLTTQKTTLCVQQKEPGPQCVHWKNNIFFKAKGHFTNNSSEFETRGARISERKVVEVKCANLTMPAILLKGRMTARSSQPGGLPLISEACPKINLTASWERDEEGGLVGVCTQSPSRRVSLKLRFLFRHKLSCDGEIVAFVPGPNNMTLYVFCTGTTQPICAIRHGEFRFVTAFPFNGEKKQEYFLRNTQTIKDQKLFSQFVFDLSEPQERPCEKSPGGDDLFWKILFLVMSVLFGLLAILVVFIFYFLHKLRQKPKPPKENEGRQGEEMSLMRRVSQERPEDELEVVGEIVRVEDPGAAGCDSPRSGLELVTWGKTVEMKIITPRPNRGTTPKFPTKTKKEPKEEKKEEPLKPQETPQEPEENEESTPQETKEE